MITLIIDIYTHEIIKQFYGDNSYQLAETYRLNLQDYYNYQLKVIQIVEI